MIYFLLSKCGLVIVDEIIAFCRNKPAAPKRPRRVEIIASDKFPRTAMGKFIRKQLREQFSQR